VSGLDAHWYRRSALAAALAPLAWLFCRVTAARRGAYRRGLLRTHRLPVPVIVVGNLTVGGTGKTPLVAWLAGVLREAGYSPGIVSRGYGGRTPVWPQLVRPDSDPREVGDEPVLLARLSGCPVMADPRRVRAAQALLEQYGCNVIVSDDGLQHYALARDIEIAVVDGLRRFGNGRCLPAGPLRERVERLDSVDLVVVNGEGGPGERGMRLVGDVARNLSDGRVRPLSAFDGDTVHAVAGIGHPARFFEALRGHGLRVIEHPFADHHAFRATEIDFGDMAPVLMTEKDAVKCERFATARCWSVPVRAEPDARVGERVLQRLKDLHGQPG
jgi:tetraacyldisaccharide 4'-kinase